MLHPTYHTNNLSWVGMQKKLKKEKRQKKKT